ncbi:DUF4091 domain-containing protein [Sphingobacterium bovistauri]|uniref:DUF4091 domain-containing protein n=1 Tax=Sphingobacterium bovistauri TaxID=2781959 RepID=A0ABS7Z9Y5_9SPHI|nr:DUF4091 domain-containing protein [Sphingobacterium bovistauri]MCA5005739.1 DUF4091 domain-containing protein [Sphingobacterium bovistauri]
MNKIFTLILMLLAITGSAQFIEPNDPKSNLADQSGWGKLGKGIYFRFVDSDFSLSKHNVPNIKDINRTWHTSAWKGETINTQLAVWSKNPEYANSILSLSFTELKSAKNIISNNNIKFNPIAYVISDDPSQLKSACGINVILDSTLVADRIMNTQTIAFNSKEVRPLWLSIKIPNNAEPGLYSGHVIASIKLATYTMNIKIPYSIRVSDFQLPKSADWDFHLDLWQNPYSSARYYNLETFSDEHLEKIKPSMQRLANAGQKNITTTLIYDPWNSQTFDKYDAMIQWIKKKDGSWQYDYTLFDKWVEYMHSIGVHDYINCYSMIPWNLSFYYFDEATNKREIIKAKPEEQVYENHWYPFLKNFAAHLKKKKWFHKTTIAMDERPMKDMQAAIRIIKKADPEFQISLAGYYHPELSDDIIDYSIPFYDSMSEDILQSRKAKGYKTTAYTCCTEIYPNTFTSSGYYEPVYLAVNTLQRGFDGYLRWAYDCWNKKPLEDTRFGSWAAGDTYLVYPENETSIRFERLQEGIQTVEKIKVLRKKLAKQGKSQELQKLENEIQKFGNKNINRNLIPTQVKSLKNLVNSL